MVHAALNVSEALVLAVPGHSFVLDAAQLLKLPLLLIELPQRLIRQFDLLNVGRVFILRHLLVLLRLLVLGLLDVALRGCVVGLECHLVIVFERVELPRLLRLLDLVTVQAESILRPGFMQDRFWPRVL